MKFLLTFALLLTPGLATAQDICPKQILDANVSPQRLAVDGNQLYAAGFQQSLGVQYGISAYDGTDWSSVPGYFNGGIYAMEPTSQGLVVAGSFTEVNGVPMARIARFQGGTWHALGSGIGRDGNEIVMAVEEFGGELYCGGSFATAGGVLAQNIAKWDGVSWQPLGAGTSGQVRALAGHNGMLIAGGSFTVADGKAMRHVAAWDGQTFFKPGLGNVPPVYEFEASGGKLFAAAKGVHALEAGQWSQLGDLDLETSIHAKALTIYNGQPIAVGDWVTFCLTFGGMPCVAAAQWNGSSWQQLWFDDQQASVQSLAAASFQNSYFISGASQGSNQTNFVEYGPGASLGSVLPKIATWYKPTQLTFSAGCIDPLLPVTVTIGNSAPIPATISSPTTVTATLPVGHVPSNGTHDVTMDQAGSKSKLPGGFEVLPSLALINQSIFQTKLSLTVKSDSQVGSAYFYAGVTSPPAPFAVPGIHGLIEIPLHQVFFLGIGSLGTPPTLEVPYDAQMVPTGVPIRFQALVAEAVGPITQWALTNSQSIKFAGPFIP